MLAKVWREGKNLYGSFSAHYHHWGVTDKKVYWLPKLLSQVSTSRMALLYRSNSLLPLSPNKGLWVMAQSPMISKSIHRCESDSQKVFMYYYVWLAKQCQIYWFWWLSQMPILNTECHSTIFIALPIWKWRKYTALSHEKGLTIMSTIFLAPHYNLKCSFQIEFIHTTLLLLNQNCPSSYCQVNVSYQTSALRNFIVSYFCEMLFPWQQR